MGKAVLKKKCRCSVSSGSPSSSTVRSDSKSTEGKQACFGPWLKWSFLPSSWCCRRGRLLCRNKWNVQLNAFKSARPFKALPGLVQCNQNADGTIKFIKLLQQNEMLSRACKVMSRKLNLKNETWSSEWDRGKRAQLIEEIKMETINIIATFIGEFKKQFVLLVLKLFCQKPDVIIYFYYSLVYLNVNTAIVSSTSQYLGIHYFKNKDIAE